MKRAFAQLFLSTPVTTLTLLTLLLAYIVLMLQPATPRSAFIMRNAAGRALDHTLIVALFIHLSPAHLLANLAGIFCFGRLVEPRTGGRWLLVAMLWCGAFSWSVYLLRQPERPASGASGVMVGLIGVFLGMQNRPLRILAAVGGLLWLLLAFTRPPGPDDVHAAGLLAGVAFSWLFETRVNYPPPRADSPH